MAEDLRKRFESRIISIDLDVAVKWGEIQGVAELSGTPILSIDELIAASGLVHNCVVVTRNTSDMVQGNVELLNPWLGVA